MKTIGNRQPTLYFQYLISYVVVLFIPLLIVGMLFYGNIVKSIQAQAMDANAKLLLQAMEQIDTKFKEMGRIAADVSMNPHISLRDFRDAYYYFTRRNMINYQLSNSFLDTVLLYDRELEYFYSSSASYTLGMFYQVYRINPEDRQDFENALDALKQPALRKIETAAGDRYIVYMRPIPIHSFQPKGAVLFLVKEQSFQSVLQRILLQTEYSAFIFDGSGNIVASANYREADGGPDLPEALRGLEKSESVAQTSLGGGDLFVSHIRSGLTGFTYVIVTPKSVLLQEVNRIRNMALRAFALILFAGGLAIYFSMRYNYNPIGRIMAQVEKMRVGRPKGRGLRRLESVLSAAAPLIRQHHLLNLLQGRKVSEEDLRLEHSRYFIAVVQSEAAFPDAMNWQPGLELLERAGHQAMHLHTEHGLTLVVPADPDGRIPVDALTAFQQWTAEATGQAVSIGVGTVYADRDRLSRSYIEAATALQHKFIYGSGKIILFDSLEHTLSKTAWSPAPLVETLLMHLERGDAEQAMHSVHKLAAGIREKSQSLFQAKSACYEVINSLIRYAQDRFPPAEQDEFAYPDIVTFASSNSVDYLLKVMTDICAKICGYVGQSGGRERLRPEERLFERMQSYILSRYADYQFSLQSMADDLQLSVSSVGRIYKQFTGTTVMESVNELRISKAKELLQNTNLPVKEIVEQIGYKDVSSFIRKFKQRFGLTPTDYRDYCRKK